MSAPHIPLQFLKLGGSLITDKTRPRTARPEVLARLAGEIAAAFNQPPGLRLVLGHGSGSFGHMPAKQYGTRQGVHTPQEWRGFVAVWRDAAALNQQVLAALSDAGLPAISLPASAALLAAGGRVQSWNIGPLQAALAAGLLPVVYGDVVFDQVRGGTIFSTEDLFEHLARQLAPRRILLAGLEPGVWADFPDCTRLVPHLHPGNLAQSASGLSGSAATDVTGGMASKVQQSLALAESLPGLEVQIFSGVEPGVVTRCLLGAAAGTRLTA